ncbi:NO-inducible flavohemoprotein [Paenibacillus sp. N3/727]|uniref:NO-inducible flavohemoprotein n=1 Tax=Paenibacillus sp. N3/727 TaxID=2925845 RepID=UPI001F53851D|nr:NO-inducible flavohemoprotein [Paenibacillus sp. N3/727]UNK20334.1 NO-inducible flavohemoprotein [Paenibacillus sp. N3/727]
MLDPHTIEIIKSTVPVLEVHGKAITTVFYQKLFRHHPELLNIFNHANQRQGKQPTALAGAVYAAAANIDRLENILPVVKQIGEKHRALNILPEHYPIVGETLLAAIKDVLGDAATPEIMDAWAKAYQIIADVFISVEADMYNTAEAAPGGWRGYRNFIIDRKVEESRVITSFYLKPEDGQAISQYEPGQYITLRVKPEGEQYTHIRHYTLSAAPGQPYYKISVKREDAADDKPAGIVSSWLHSHAEPGTVVELSAPAGSFTLDQTDEHPLVLISGGVGLTPMVSMLEAALSTQPQRPVTYIHSAIDGSHHAMKEHIEKLASTHKQLNSYVIYERPLEGESCHKTGYIDLSFLRDTVDPMSDCYFCGPLPFMSSVQRDLKALGLPDERIHYEFFGPAASLEA